MGEGFWYSVEGYGVEWFHLLIEGGAMDRFVGRYEHSLDDKGRIILPAKFRPSFERGGYLTEHREGCLALWTPTEFERQLAALQRSASEGARQGRNRARLWAAHSQEVEVDKQGRMPISAYLRGFAQLDGDVLVHGAIDRIELWSPTAWEQVVAPDEQWFLEDDGE